MFDKDDLKGWFISGYSPLLGKFSGTIIGNVSGVIKVKLPDGLIAFVVKDEVSELKRNK